MGCSEDAKEDRTVTLFTDCCCLALDKTSVVIEYSVKEAYVKFATQT
jgi:hypothetical protein